MVKENPDRKEFYKILLTLFSQVEKLQNELVLQGKAKEALEMRESEVEKKTQELTYKLADVSLPFCDF